MSCNGHETGGEKLAELMGAKPSLSSRGPTTENNGSMYTSGKRTELVINHILVLPQGLTT